MTHPGRAHVDPPAEDPADRDHPGLPRPAATTGRGPARSGVAPIIIENLTKRFGRLTAVDGLSFTVAPGRVTGFLGPNGAGKTTTMRVLLGLAAATAGRATFGDRAYVDLPEPQRLVGCVLEANFHPGRTGRDHLR